MDDAEIVPHSCLYLDASWKDILYGLHATSLGRHDRTWVTEELRELWTTPTNPNHVLSCLSVRSSLDLFLRVKNFPHGSEVIMSAINIPSMVQVVLHHGLKPVPCDVSLDTLAPKVELLESLVTDKSVAILVAHIYGKQTNLDPWIEAAKKHKLLFIEDAAEAFCGLKYVGHPDADLSLFSFGTIKFYTAFGGAICKIKDRKLYEDMLKLHNEYPFQSSAEYLQKLIKIVFIYIALNCPKFLGTSYSFLRTFGIEPPKSKIVSLLRGFPGDLIKGIRCQPSTALLSVLFHRLSSFDASDYNIAQVKGDYVSENLPKGVTTVGHLAHVRNFWLFPIVVENPDEMMKRLWAMGVDAYRGATQLNVIESTNGFGPPGTSGDKKLEHMITHDPLEAKYLIDHVLYLPVNKHVSFQHLDRICKAVDLALRQMREERGQGQVKIQSKL
ncbi:uncharacterized protein LOC135499776 [Lineus longissimus]|uniref:uncharacterized protein LOC135499776 n=1 Tax=Lineus longissimus TaxID=88925 RepID=UPI002B4D8B7A